MSELVQIETDEATSFEKENSNSCPPNTTTTEDPNSDLRAVMFKDSGSLTDVTVGVCFFSLATLPDNAVIDSIALHCEVDFADHHASSARNWVIEWYDGSNYPPSTDDYQYKESFSNVALTQAITGISTGENTFTLSNVDFVDPAATRVGIRTFISGGCGSIGGTNRFWGVAIHDQTEVNPPRLDITYHIEAGRLKRPIKRAVEDSVDLIRTGKAVLGQPRVA